MKRSLLLVPVLILAAMPHLRGQDNYGKTPDKLLPYRNFQEPYKAFFDEPQPFLGPGREKKPPSDLESIKIGFLGPLEGSKDFEMGRQMLNGAMLALEEANEKGGYKGIPFELILHNDVGLWGAAANEIVKMNDEQVWAILGSIDGTVTHVALRVALKLEIPMVNTGDPDPTLTETRIPWIIRVIGDDRQSSYALANHIFNKKGLSKIAVLRVNNRYGRVGSAEFRDSARRFGLPLVMEIRYAEGDTLFTEQLTRISQSGADGLVLWVDNATDGANILKEMNQLEISLPVFACDRVVSPRFLEEAGILAESVTATYPYNPTLDDPKLIAFNTNYVRRFEMQPDMFAAHAYDGMNILLDAINIAGLNRVLIRDVLTDLETFQGYEGVTGEIILDPSWNDVGLIWMVQIRDGEFNFFENTQDVSSNFEDLK